MGNGTDQGAVWVAPLEGVDAELDPAYVHENARCHVEGTTPSLALDALDRPMVLHRSPQGLTLATRDDTGWKSEIVLPQAAWRTRLVLDETDTAAVRAATDVMVRATPSSASRARCHGTRPTTFGTSNA